MAPRCFFVAHQQQSSASSSVRGFLPPVTGGGARRRRRRPLRSHFFASVHRWDGPHARRHGGSRLAKVWVDARFEMGSSVEFLRVRDDDYYDDGDDDDGGGGGGGVRPPPRHFTHNNPVSDEAAHADMHQTHARTHTSFESVPPRPLSWAFWRSSGSTNGSCGMSAGTASEFKPSFFGGPSSIPERRSSCVIGEVK